MGVAFVLQQSKTWSIEDPVMVVTLLVDIIGFKYSIRIVCTLAASAVTIIGVRSADIIKNLK